MNLAAVEQIAKAVLYEGYMLYPYRPTSVKNQQRFNFGVVYPRAYSDAQNGCDPWTMQSECLLEGSENAKLEVRVRFLQLVERSVEKVVHDSLSAGQEPSFQKVASLTVGDETVYSWQEAVERELILPPVDPRQLLAQASQKDFAFAATSSTESLTTPDGAVVGRILRTRASIKCEVCVSAVPVSEKCCRINVRIRNTTPLDRATGMPRQDVLMQSQVSTHLVLGIEGGAFISLLDPPEALRQAASECHNVGAYPLLVGEEGQHDTVLCSPIILYDYPQIAPESVGDLFDGTEIDEILSLRIMTMTDEEKREVRQSDARARQMLDRTDALPAEHLMKLHGVLRGLRPVKEDAP